MFGFLAAALSAPLAVAGGISKGTGEALEIGAGDIGLFRAAGQGLQGAGDLMTAGAGAMNDKISGMGFTLDGMGVDIRSLGQGMMGSFSALTQGRAPEVSKALVRAPAIEAPAVNTIGEKFQCDMNDVVCPPTPGGGGGARIAGL